MPPPVSTAINCSFSLLNQETVSSVSSLEGVKSASSALSLWVFDPDHFKRVLGVDWEVVLGLNTLILAMLITHNNRLATVIGREL